MLKVIIENYNSFNNVRTNKQEFCTAISKYRIFEWARMNFRRNLRHEFWDNLGYLEIVINDYESVSIRVEEIDSIKDSGDLDYIIKNKYIKTP